jgi:hypothetical protein
MILTEENGRTSRETCPSATLSTANATWTVPGANQGINRLSYDTAELMRCYTLCSHIIFISTKRKHKATPR